MPRDESEFESDRVSRVLWSADESHEHTLLSDSFQMSAWEESRHLGFRFAAAIERNMKMVLDSLYHSCFWRYQFYQFWPIAKVPSAVIHSNVHSGQLFSPSLFQCY